ncbi:MAG: serine hydrolase domain-containing protein [Hyphomonadaceae bacterium]
MRNLILLACAVLMACSTAHGDLSGLSVRTAVQRQAREGFSGAVLVAQRGEVLLDEGFGVIRNERMRPSSRFWIASVGKQFTSAALMRCADEGHVRIDMPLSEIWPDSPADKRAITIRQVLAHASGLPQSDDAEFSTDGEAARRTVLALPLAAAPGERFIYSNANYELAAAIVERSCGSSYADYIRTEIIERIQLPDTGQIPDVENPHTVPFLGDRPARLNQLRWGGQGYFSTTHDLYRWHEALIHGQILSPSSRDTLFEPVIDIQEGQSALGWFIGRTDSGAVRIFTRGNEDAGPNALLYYYPATDTTIIVLTHAGDKNDDTSWSRAVHAEIESILGL